MSDKHRDWSARDLAELTHRAGDLRNGLTEEAAAHLLRKGRVQRFQKGVTILDRGAGVARFFMTLSGTARLVAVTEDGREFVSSFMGPGRMWGLHPCLEQSPEAYDTRAETDCTILVLEAKNLRDLMWENREIQEAMTEILCKRLRLALTVLEQFATWTPKQRLAWRIFQIVQGTADIGTEITRQSIAISQDAIAAMIGLSRQRTNKLLKEFERDGIVKIEYGSIRVTDPSGLEFVFGNAVAT